METGIDTMILQSKLSKADIDHIFNSFKGWYPTRYYDYNLSLEEYGVFIQLYSRNSFKFNVKITLQTKFFSLAHVPFTIQDVLALDLSVTSLQIAFDSHTSLSNSFAYKHHGNVKHRQITDDKGHSTLYFGAFNPSNKSDRAISYDRNEKEVSRNMENGVNHLFSNRYEVRLSFKIGEQPLNNINHELILAKLSRNIFVKNIAAMETDGYTKRKFQRIRTVYDRLDYQYKEEKGTLKDVAKANREPLEQYYSEKKDSLFSFLNSGGNQE